MNWKWCQRHWGKTPHFVVLKTLIGRNPRRILRCSGCIHCWAEMVDIQYFDWHPPIEPVAEEEVPW